MEKLEPTTDKDELNLGSLQNTLTIPEELEKQFTPEQNTIWDDIKRMHSDLNDLGKRIKELQIYNQTYSTQAPRCRQVKELLDSDTDE